MITSFSDGHFESVLFSEHTSLQAQEQSPCTSMLGSYSIQADVASTESIEHYVVVSVHDSAVDGIFSAYQLFNRPIQAPCVTAWYFSVTDTYI